MLFRIPTNANVVPMLYQKKKALSKFASKPCLSCGVGRDWTGDTWIFRL